MSKIEKALRKAQLVGAARPVAHRPDSSAATALVPTRETRSLMPTAPQSGALSAIARMQESYLLVPDELSNRGIIHPDMPEAGTVKAFRDVRTKILQKSQGRNAVIMVTSPVPDPQTSLVTLNIAAAFAFDAGRTALAVDCDVRHRVFSSILDVANARGLSDYLTEEECDIGSVVHSVGIERVRMIPAGTQTDLNTEAFTTERMRRLIEDVYRRYPERYVILDAPPLTESADTQILADLCDYVLVVIPYGRVTASTAAEAMKNLDPKKIVGVVLNGEPSLPQARVFPARLAVSDWVDAVRSWVARVARRSPEAARSNTKAN